MAKKKITPETHPWVLARRNTDDVFFKTKIDAIRFCEARLVHIKQHLAMYDKTVPVRVDDILQELHNLPAEGGWVEAVVDEYTGAIFDAHIYRRAA